MYDTSSNPQMLQMRESFPVAMQVASIILVHSPKECPVAFSTTVVLLPQEQVYSISPSAEQERSCRILEACQAHTCSSGLLGTSVPPELLPRLHPLTPQDMSDKRAKSIKTMAIRLNKTEIFIMPNTFLLKRLRLHYITRENK